MAKLTALLFVWLFALLGVAHAESGIASWYGPPEPSARSTACGDRGVPAMSAAHRTLPCNTKVKVTKGGGTSITVTIRDRGPFIAGRVIDLDPVAAKALGIVGRGLAKVHLQVVAGVVPVKVKTVSFTKPKAASKPKAKKRKNKRVWRRW